MTALKNLLLDVLRLPGITLPFTRLMRGRAAVFMLHRFDEPDLDIQGHNPALLRRVLEYLRRHKYELLSVQELLLRLAGEGPPLRRAVAFTIDDGYAETATVARPLFAAFDCPVTVFVVTGFLDGHLWLWWDQIESIFKRTSRNELALRLDGTKLHYRWNDHITRDRSLAACVRHCVRVGQEQRQIAIEDLAREAEVDLPEHAPPRYAAMSWEQARSCEHDGMTFGPQTVTHTVLNHLSDEESRKEIADSWEKLREEVQSPVPVFCYPNGREKDFGLREIAILKSLDFLGAVTAIPGYNGRTSSTGESEVVFQLRRFSYPDSISRFIQYASGVEYAKEILRTGLRKT